MVLAVRRVPLSGVLRTPALISLIYLTGIASCKRASDGQPIQRPLQVGQYELRLDTLSTHVQGPQQAVTQARQSSGLRVRIDSIRGDSAFGSFSGNLGDYGLFIGAMPGIPTNHRDFNVVVVSAGQRIDMLLGPPLPDATVDLAGHWVGDTVQGVWTAPGGGQVRGRFQLFRN